MRREPEQKPLYPSLFISRQAADEIRHGYPWSYPRNIEQTGPGITDGCLCHIYCGKQFIGTGTYHSGADIPLRVLTRSQDTIDTHFLRKRLLNLKEHKEEFLTDTNAYRLVNGEADGLPGLIVDIYNRAAVIQILTMGMENLKQPLVSALISVVKPQVILERSHSGIRAKEGLPAEVTEVLYGRLADEVDVTENGFVFRVNIKEGQKTGFFLDQRENRKALIPYCRDRFVLNCYCYTGGFSVYAASVAASVTSVDISAPAIGGARTNFSLNGYNLDQHQFLAVDAFDYLKGLSHGQYQVIILDPPSFAPNKSQLDAAIKAYTTINTKALEKLPDYGILVSASCSSHMDDARFLQMLTRSSTLARCQVKVLETRTQPPDHTWNLSYPEGRYLKFFVLQKWPL